MLLALAADGGGRLFDACGAAPRPQALALHGHTAPLVPAAHMACPGDLADAGSLQHHMGEGQGPWGADVSHRHRAIPHWEAGLAKAPLGTGAGIGCHIHQGHAALADQHRTCGTVKLCQLAALKHE